jgi:hypothetical protein
MYNIQAAKFMATTALKTIECEDQRKRWGMKQPSPVTPYANITG